MASQLSGSNKLLDIRTKSIDFVIKTKGKEINTAVENSGKFSSLKVGGSDIERISIPEQKVYEAYEDHRGIAYHELKVHPLFFEQTDYVLTIHGRNGEQLELLSNSSLNEDRIGRVIDEDASLLSGVLNFGNEVGYVDFYVNANGKNVLHVVIEIYPSKISYHDDYKAMMTDINNMVSECALDFMKKTYQDFAISHERNDVPSVFFTSLRTIYDKFLRAGRRILAVPHHKLITKYDIVPAYKAKKLDDKSNKWLIKHPQHVLKQNGLLRVEKVLSAEKIITYDTQENQLVKFILTSTVRKIEDFLFRYKATAQEPIKKILDEASKMSVELRSLVSSTFLADVSEYKAVQSMSLVFEMAPGYRELYKYYLILQNGFSVGGDVFHMSVKDTAQLYEYWCFIKLYSILKQAKDMNGNAKYPLESPDIIKVNRRGVTVDLIKGRQSKVVFINTKTGERITLAYNPLESKTQTVNQKPDNILELEKKNSSTAYKYVFDAKYRIESMPDGQHYPDKNPGPKLDDINTMHRYRDSIVYENPNSRFTFEKTMFGAYVLFPYDNEVEYKNHRFYKSIESVNIGGLPFLPSAIGLVQELLDTLISDSADSAFERASLPVGIESRLRKVDWDKRDVLIGLVPDDEYLQMCLKNKAYFTKRFSNRNLPVRYVALYEKQHGIRYYGDVVTWRQTDSSELPETCLQSGAYNVFEVLKWKKLPETIKMEEAGPNPVAYTNEFLLTSGKTYSELRLRSEEEYRLFQELKRQADAKVLEDNDSDICFETNSAKIVSNRDKIYVIKNKKLLVECATSEFRKKPNATFRMLQSYVNLES